MAMSDETAQPDAGTDPETMSFEAIQFELRSYEPATEFGVVRTEAHMAPQPDGSIACIPEWMTDERATHIKLSSEPCFSLEIVRSMRAEVDALLAFLPSESSREKEAHE
jgi:hypothetical protein